MNIKKIAIMASFVMALAYANFASAVAWSPLVRIPGLPATGTVNLSMYMIGLYNFLLSIVGIVAVMMLIIGGMRYITAAGNAAAISDAKDIIQNAVVGLIIALFSWVFIATINPDALYIKQPGASFLTTTVHGVCYQSFDPGSGACTCIDGTPIPSPPAPLVDAEACELECQDFCNIPDSYACIAQGSPTGFESSAFKDKNSVYYGKCKCIDGEFATPLFDGIPDPANCNDVCSNPAFTVPTDVPGGDYHGINWDLRVGPSTDTVRSLRKGENFTVNVNEPVYFDFSNMKDCRGEGALVHVAVKWDGAPTWLSFAPDEWCCFNSDPNCSSTWGNCCNIGGCWCGVTPSCNTAAGSHLFDSPDFPIYVHTFTTITPHNDPEDVWAGASVKMDLTCAAACSCHDDSLERIFQVIVQ